MFIQRDKNLAASSTLRLSARAQAYVVFDERRQLAALLSLVHQYSHWQVLAGGSNVVLGQQVPGLTIGMCTRGVYLTQETEHEYLVEVEAGESWHDFVRFSLAQGWYGLENLALIPGTVGAAPVQNIGAYGVEVRQFIRWVEAWDAQTQTVCKLSADECEFSYRDSLFKRSGPGRWLILRVAFAFPKRWEPVLNYPDLQSLGAQKHSLAPTDVFLKVCEVRRHKLPDPEQLPNAGSFFKNPVISATQAAALKKQWPGLRYFAQTDGSVKLAAGWLIEQAGWKGRCLGPVGMHNRQALVLVNHAAEQADERDVQRLTERVRAEVKKLFAVSLEQEPIYLGSMGL